MPRYLESKEDLYYQLGKLVVSWSTLENNLAIINAGMLGSPYQEKIPIFYAILSNRARSDLLKKSALSMSLTRNQQSILDKIITRVLRLNTTRNKYIHGTYAKPRKGEKGISIIDFSSPTKSDEYLNLGNQSKIGSADIMNHIRAVEILSNDVREFAKTELKLFLGPLEPPLHKSQ